MDRPALASVLIGLVLAARAGAVPIPQDPLADPVPAYVGAPAVPQRVRARRIPQHPFKPGQTNFGSGTTPTLMGRNYWRRSRFSRPRHLCSVAVFGADAGATENSLMGTHRSLVVENNYGYSGLTAVMNGATTEPGLVYTYTKDPGPNATDAWYLTAIDFRSGATVWKQLVGTGFGYNNNFAPVTLGRDGTAYVGVLGGLTATRDAP